MSECCICRRSICECIDLCPEEMIDSTGAYCCMHIVPYQHIDEARTGLDCCPPCEALLERYEDEEIEPHQLLRFQPNERLSESAVLKKVYGTQEEMTYEELENSDIVERYKSALVVEALCLGLLTIVGDAV